ncbi:LamG-like jellyroll fold domain-containing protein [Paeniglutamicibacter gangotriensis]|uniref:LamG domain-containing protein n=1 Tax=Paeniglutamicibacter gangotriensis TaxID=254787 RepID=UPI0037C91527
MIETIETAGFESGAWTVNETSTMQRFIGWGIDRLYTDSADQALLLFGVDPREGLERGLLGHWSLDDVIGRTADDSGSPNPIRNGLLQSDAELTARGHSHLKAAVALDGTGDYVDVPFEVLPEEAPAYTASVWFKPERVGTRQPLLESSGSGAISMELAETGNLKYSIQTDGTPVVAESDIAPAAGQWHHAALTYDAATGSSHLFLDGEKITEFIDPQGTVTGTLAWTDGLRLGADREADRFFQGALDDTALWNRALTGDELATIWNDGNGTAVHASFREAKGTPGWWEPRKN